MYKVGDVELKLAKGPIPHYKELKELAKHVISLMEYELGTKEVINRFSNPLWYNSFACLLGFEWNYSGMTTVVLKAIKESLSEIDTGLIALGGKGKSANIIKELENADIKDKLKEKLSRVSKYTAKIDNNLVQDGYDLYFHFILADEKGNFTVINQKMNIDEQKVRRFHWLNSWDFLSYDQEGFGIKTKTLNISGNESKDLRESMVSLLNEKDIDFIKKYVIRLSNRTNTITKYFTSRNTQRIQVFQELPEYLRIPRKLYWDALKISDNIDNFYQLLDIKGVGRGLLRALAYTSSLIYGTEISWRDPIRYTFAHGTKVGRPYYVNKKLMLEEAEFIKNALSEAKLGRTFKLKIIRILSKYIE